jgi:hypothetical protein
VQADVFLLTDAEPNLLAGPGLRLERSEPASVSLLDDLRADKGMSWVPNDMWLTYLKADVDVGDLAYDLAATPTRDTTPKVRDTGVGRADALVAPRLDETGGPWPVALVVGVAAALAVLGVAISVRPARGRRPAAADR